MDREMSQINWHFNSFQDRVSLKASEAENKIMGSVHSELGRNAALHHSDPTLATPTVAGASTHTVHSTGLTALALAGMRRFWSKDRCVGGRRGGGGV